MFLEYFSTNRMNFVQIADFDFERLNFRNKYPKIFSEAIKGMKLKLCINVHDISLYINYIFYCRCPCAFVAMAT